MKRVGGVADGARTHDNRNHNPGLYQHSYSHRREKSIASRTDAAQLAAADAAAAAAKAAGSILTL